MLIRSDSPIRRSLFAQLPWLLIHPGSLPYPPVCGERLHTSSSSRAVTALDGVKDDVEEVVRHFPQQLSDNVAATDLVVELAGEALELGVQGADKLVRVLTTNVSILAPTRTAGDVDLLELLNRVGVIVVLDDAVRQELEVDQSAKEGLADLVHKRTVRVDNLLRDVVLLGQVGQTFDAVDGLSKGAVETFVDVPLVSLELQEAESTYISATTLSLGPQRTLLSFSSY